MALTCLLNVSSFGMVMFDYVPWGRIIESGLIAIVVGSVLSLLGGIMPAYRAAKMEPVDAMGLEV